MSIQAHLTKGQKWESELYLSQQRRTKLAWVVAALAVIVAVAEAIALAALAPLKEPVPYVITVDKHTGYLEIAKELDDGPLPKQEALRDYYLVKYVTAREAYLPELIEQRYYQTQAMSESSAAKEHKALWDGQNPDNPSAILGEDGEVVIEIINVTPLNNKTASVRFERRTIHNNETVEKRYNAIVVYRFDNGKQTQEMRLMNPLGFKVRSYRVTEEITP